MKKKLALILLLFFSLFVFVGCSSNVPPYDGDTGGGVSEQSLILSDPLRKIIYTASISVKSNNILQTTNAIKSELVAGEDWVESEEMTESSNYIILRVKTSRLNDFINALQNDYETSNFSLESRDVSLDYVNTEAEKDSLQASKDRLEALKATATVQELIEIEERISQIDTRLNVLESTLITYDSQIEYSKVKVYIHGQTVNPNPPTYGEELAGSFYSGWEALVSVLKFFGQVFMTLLPFILVSIPIVGIILVVIFRKRIKECCENRKAKKSQKPEETSIEEAKVEETTKK